MSTTTATQSAGPAALVAAVIDYAASAHRRAAAVLVFVALLAFIPGFFQIPPVDRDEAYFAQATKQMIETGDYVNIRYQDAVRYRKPVGIYWLQAAVVKTAQALGLPDASTTIWLYRVPSLLAALGAVLATYWCALTFVSRRGAFLAGLMMASSIGLGVEAHLAKTDAVLVFASVVAMGVLARAYLAPRLAAALPWLLPALFWTALAVGILVKGPLIVMFVALAAAALSILDRSAGWLKALRPLPGLIWLCLLVLPWFVAIIMRAGSSFLIDSVGHDMLAKIANGREAHGGPPGYYLVLFFVTFFPGAMLAVPAVPGIWRSRREPKTRFLLAWLLPSWIVFELVATKLPHYVLPLYPAIAILLAAAIESRALSSRPWMARATIWWLLIPFLLAAGAVAATYLTDRQLGLLAWPLFAAAIFCGFLAYRSYRDDGAEAGLVRAAAAGILIAIGVYGIILPSLARAFPAVQLADVLHRATCKNPVAASAGFEEPSLVFLAGTRTQLTDASSAADFLRDGSCRFAFIAADEEGTFLRRAQALGLHYTAGPEIDGFNISNGRRVRIAVFQSAATP